MYLFVACLSYLNIDQASLSRWSTVPTPNRDTSNIWALSRFLQHLLLLNTFCLYCLLPIWLSTGGVVAVCVVGLGVYIILRGGRGYSFVAYFISELTIDYASLSRRPPFLLRIETPSTFGCSIRFFLTLH